MVNLFQYTYMLSQSPKNLSTNQFEFIIYQGPAEYKDLHTCILGHWWPISNGSLIQFPEIERPVEPGVSQGSKVWGLLIINLSLTQGWGQVEQLSWSLSNEEPPLFRNSVNSKPNLVKDNQYLGNDFPKTCQCGIYKKIMWKNNVSLEI